MNLIAKVIISYYTYIKIYHSSNTYLFNIQLQIQQNKNYQFYSYINQIFYQIYYLISYLLPSTIDNKQLYVNIIIKQVMLKNNNEVLLQQTPVISISQLRSKIKQKYPYILLSQSVIANYSNSIRKKRGQMKLFSDQMTKLIQKKLIPKNQAHMQSLHSKFNPQFNNPQLQQLYSQRQSIYNEIGKLRQSVSQLSSQEQPQIKNEIRRKQGILANLIKQQQKIIKQKSILEQQLNKNKEILLHYKESQCIRQIQQNQQLLQSIKKQMRQCQKQIKNIVNQQINISLYTAQIQQHMISMEKQQQIQDEVDKKIIDQVIQDIRNVMEEKRIADRLFQAKKEQVMKKIRYTFQQNNKLQKDIKKVTTQQLKIQLQRKKKQLSKYQSTPHILYKQQSLSKNKYKKKQKSIIKSKQLQNELPSLLLTQPQEKNIKPKQFKKKGLNKQNSQSINVVYIGEWKQENLIKDDIIESRNISRAINIKIRTRDKKIIGIGVTYIDTIGVQVLGRSNIWKISQEKLQQGQQQYFIDLEDVVSIYYSPTSQNSTKQSVTPPIANSSIGLKFMTKSSKPVLKIGDLSEQQQLQHINLQNKFIKTLEFTLDSSYKLISGIKLTLISIKSPQLKKSQDSEHEQQENFDNIQMPNKITDSLMPSKWLSTTSQAGLTQKKIFVKKITQNRKLNDIPQVDHRLMLNRKKKMV